MTRLSLTHKPARNGTAFVIGLILTGDFTTVSRRRRFVVGFRKEMVFTVRYIRFCQDTRSVLTPCKLEWAKKGIIGRGVLIDYYSYALEEGIEYDPWSYHKIPVSVVKKIAERRGVVFQPGDILLLRTGTLSQSCYTRSHSTHLPVLITSNAN
jgi:hypothetical protein